MVSNRHGVEASPRIFGFGLPPRTIRGLEQCPEARTLWGVTWMSIAWIEFSDER
jgi:hypothetical protein